MNLVTHCLRTFAAAALSAASVFAVGAVQAAEPASFSVAQMAGSWRMAFSGFTGCGNTSMLMDVTLAQDGRSVNGVLTQHGSCGDSVLAGQAFRIESLSSDGSGTAAMGCGDSCGWNLIIQVSRDRQTFNMVDVDPINPGNYISGVAVKRQQP